MHAKLKIGARVTAAACAIWLISPITASATGAEHTLTSYEFYSRTYNNTRLLRVLTPPGYDLPENATRTYPVLYLNDGQNLFDAATSTYRSEEWRVDEIVAELVATGAIVPMIVVGIDNGGREGRAREYLPYFDDTLSPPEPDPQGKDYPGFLVEEVLPFVEARVRVSTRPEQRAIGGSSYGALAAVYALIHRPGVFGAALIESPSLYVYDQAVLKEALDAQIWPAKFYLGVGTNEENQPNCVEGTESSSEIVEEVKILRQIIEHAGGTRTELIVESCGRHEEEAWARRLPLALAFLFGG